MHSVTDPTIPTRPGARSMSPADAAEYDSPRNVRARAKGLPGAAITGGDDPDIGPALAQDRRLSRWLIAMVISIIGAGFVLGVVIAIVGTAAR